MKRTHIHVGVSNIAESVARYAALFGAQPSVLKEDYAKWLLDDPALNFAISTREGQPGAVSHLGIQLDDETELSELADRVRKAGARTEPETNAHCCYARSDKEWTQDPDGLIWELFVTHDQDEAFGEARAPDARGEDAGKACCG